MPRDNKSKAKKVPKEQLSKQEMHDKTIRILSGIHERGMEELKRETDAALSEANIRNNRLLKALEADRDAQLEDVKRGMAAEMLKLKQDMTKDHAKSRQDTIAKLTVNAERREQEIADEFDLRYAEATKSYEEDLRSLNNNLRETTNELNARKKELDKAREALAAMSGELQNRDEAAAQVEMMRSANEELVTTNQEKIRRLREMSEEADRQTELKIQSLTALKDKEIREVEEKRQAEVKSLEERMNAQKSEFEKVTQDLRRRVEASDEDLRLRLSEIDILSAKANESESMRDQAQAELETLRGELSTYTQKSDDLLKEVESGKMTVVEMQARMKELEADRDLHRNRHDEVKSEMGNRTTRISQYERAREQAEMDRERAKVHNKQLRAQYEHTASRMASLEDAIKECGDENANSKTIVKNLSKKVKTLDRQNKMAMKKIKEIAQERNLGLEKIQMLEGEVLESGNLAQAKDLETKSVRRQMADQLAKHEEALSQAKDRNDRCALKNEQSMDLNAQKDAQIKALAEENRALRTKLSNRDRTPKVREVPGELPEGPSNDDIIKLRKSLEVTEAENKSLRKEIAKFGVGSRQTKALKREYDAMRETVDACAANMARLQAKYKEERLRNESVGEQSSTLQQKYEALFKKYEAQKAEAEARVKELADIKTNSLECAKQSKEMKDYIDKLELSVKEESERVKNHESKLVRSENKMTNSAAELKQLQDKIAELEAALKSCPYKLERVEIEAEAESVSTQLETQQRAHERDLDKYRQALEKARESAKGLEEMRTLLEKYKADHQNLDKLETQNLEMREELVKRDKTLQAKDKQIQALSGKLEALIQRMEVAEGRMVKAEERVVAAAKMVKGKAKDEHDVINLSIKREAEAKLAKCANDVRMIHEKYSILKQVHENLSRQVKENQEAVKHHAERIRDTEAHKEALLKERQARMKFENLLLKCRQSKQASFKESRDLGKALKNAAEEDKRQDGAFQRDMAEKNKEIQFLRTQLQNVTAKERTRPPQTFKTNNTEITDLERQIPRVAQKATRDLQKLQGRTSPSELPQRAQQAMKQKSFRDLQMAERRRQHMLRSSMNNVHDNQDRTLAEIQRALRTGGRNPRAIHANGRMAQRAARADLQRLAASGQISRQAFNQVQNSQWNILDSNANYLQNRLANAGPQGFRQYAPEYANSLNYQNQYLQNIRQDGLQRQNAAARNLERMRQQNAMMGQTIRQVEANRGSFEEADEFLKELRDDSVKSLKDMERAQYDVMAYQHQNDAAQDRINANLLIGRQVAKAVDEGTQTLPPIARRTPREVAMRQEMDRHGSDNNRVLQLMYSNGDLGRQSLDIRPGFVHSVRDARLMTPMNAVYTPGSGASMADALDPVVNRMYNSTARNGDTIIISIGYQDPKAEDTRAVYITFYNAINQVISRLRKEKNAGKLKMKLVRILANERDGYATIDLFNNRNSLGNCNYETCQASEREVNNFANPTAMIQSAVDASNQQMSAFDATGNSHLVLSIKPEGAQSAEIHITSMIFTDPHRMNDTVISDSWANYLMPSANRETTSINLLYNALPDDAGDPETVATVNDRIIQVANSLNDFFNRIRGT